MTGVRRGGLALTALFALSLGCGEGGAPVPGKNGPPDGAVPSFIPLLELDPGLEAEIRLKAEESALRHENTTLGWRCGYQKSWLAVLDDARDKAPLRWRAHTVSAVLVMGLVCFGLGLIGTFLLAYLLPRLRRRQRPRRDDDANGWLAFFRDGLRRFLATLGRVLRVDYFDRSAARTRAEAIHEARDAERMLRGAKAALAKIPDAPPERVRLLTDAIGAWRDDVASVRYALEGSGAFSADVSPNRSATRLAAARKAAARLYKALLRHGVLGRTPDGGRWDLWQQLVEERPTLPYSAARRAKERPLERWVRPVGWIGVFGMSIALPMLAAWTAAGAFPLFFALLFALVSIGAVLTARVHLFQAGGAALLPGLADRLAGWLTALTVAVTVLVALSAMATAESGLDLGDPPPVDLPTELQQTPPPAAAADAPPDAPP